MQSAECKMTITLILHPFSDSALCTLHSALSPSQPGSSSLRLERENPFSTLQAANDQWR